MIREWVSRTFDAFSQPSYRILWAGTLFAFVAFTMSFTVQSVVAFDLTGANRTVGLVGLGQGVAWFIIGPAGGVLADLVSKRKLLMFAQGAIALTFATLGALIVTGQIAVAFLVMGSFVVGLSFAFTGPARRAYVTDVVRPEKLGNAIALMQSALSTPGIVGPAIAGLLISVSFVGAGGTYFLMAGLLGLVLISLRWLPPGHPRTTERRSIRVEFLEGLRHVWGRPRLRLLLGTFLSLAFLGFSFQVLIPGLLEHELGRPARDIGLLQSVAGVASLTVGLVLAGFVGSRRAPELMYALGCCFAGSLLLLAIVPNFGLALPIMLLLGTGNAGFQVVNNALVITAADPVYHGRVMALTMFAFGAQGLMGLPVGALGDAVGERPVLAGMGAAVLLLMAFAFLAHLRLPAPERLRPAAPVATAGPVAD